jgi:ABC-type nickel/cobalt efflux system permease component RcnA
LIFGRRVRFALVILASQLLLMALAVTWVVQMVLIALNGSIMFVEYNPGILLFEIILSILICLFALIVFINQLKRLGEKRRSDDREYRVRENDPD